MADAPNTLEQLEDALLRPGLPLRTRVRRVVGSVLIDNFFTGASWAGRLVPGSHPRWHRVQVERDIPYTEPSEHPEHRLDVWSPTGARERGEKLPIVLYLHGGGFRILSKDSHWLFGLLFARRGYLVFNVGYRLAPKHPFPAALEDAAKAYAWVVRNAERFGGDPSRIVLAGESAGANLATSVALCTSYRRPEPFAREVFELGVQPKAVLPACGVLQVSDPERFVRERKVGNFIADRLAEVADSYLHGHRKSELSRLELADPLLVLERGERPERPLPPFFATCGTGDVLIDDSHRLERALQRLGVDCEARYYDGELHAFHAFVFLPNARRCWRDTFEFLERRLRPPSAVAS
jgi:acetyl esterase